MERALNEDIFEPVGGLHQIGASKTLVGMQLYKGHKHSQGVPLTELMLDRRANTGVARNDKPLSDRTYFINLHEPMKSSGLYLIRMKDANRTVVKLGRGKQIMRRLSNYKTALPL